jgi:hypothetical protein
MFTAPALDSIEALSPQHLYVQPPPRPAQPALTYCGVMAERQARCGHGTALQWPCK